MTAENCMNTILNIYSQQSLHHCTLYIWLQWLMMLLSKYIILEARCWMKYLSLSVSQVVQFWEGRETNEDGAKGSYSHIPDRVGKWKGVVREERVCNIVEKWKMSATRCCVALHRISWDGPWWKKWASVMVFKDSIWRSKLLILHYPWHVPSIPFQTIDISVQCGVPFLACDVYKI